MSYTRSYTELEAFDNSKLTDAEFFKAISLLDDDDAYIDFLVKLMQAKGMIKGVA